MPLVNVIFKEVHFEVEADTVGELKSIVGDEDHLDIEVDKWHLFQFGFVLPESPDAKLEDFIDENGEIRVNLVRPEEPPRGQPRKVLSDRTRFLVRGKRSKFEILELSPMKTLTTKLKQSCWFSGTERFGIVTSTIGLLEEAGNRQVQFDVYEMKQKGHIALMTSPESDDEVLVYLVPEGVTDKSDMVQLFSTDVKVYHEKDIITPLARRQLVAKYVEAVIQGITGGLSGGM